jgi:hypothetical protein
MAMSPKLLRPRATGFNPKSISGLIGWWDFSDASTLGPSSSGTGTVSNNGPIKYVADKSGASAAMIQTGADSVAPTYLTSGQNNLSVAGFDGGDSMASTFTRTFSAQTVFAVARMASASNANARLFTQSDAGNDFGTTGHYIPLQREASSESISSYAFGGGRAAVSVTYDTWFLACSRHTGSQIQNRINNGSSATYSHTLSKEFTRFGIGEGLPSFGTRWQNRIAEIVLFSRSLTDSEMNAVARWLGKKWSITVA